jgi:hypothetical protein
MHTGTFSVEAEDNTGELVTVEHTFTIMVEGGMDEEFFHGGDWEGAWGDDSGRGGVFSDRGGGGMIVFPGDDMGRGGMMMTQDEPSAFANFMQRIFRTESAPDWWDDNAMGGDFETLGRMMGHEPVVRTNWFAVLLVLASIAAMIAVPIALSKKIKKSKLKLEDEE